MNDKKPRKATTPDALRWSIFLTLAAASPALLAQGSLQPAPGPGGTPLINDAHGVPVIEIVAPNASGLSHNQFLNYNIGQAGAVLNNALQAGQSQLAGALAANPQFQGQAASTILNEVISRNASLIEGPQEIFGRPADYILANSNGITLNGGSFINTTRAGFLVGDVQLEDGRVRLLDSRNAHGTLSVLDGGQSNDGGALELIAPRIDSKGTLKTRDDLQLIAGRNRIDASNGQVLEHLPGTPASIDASLFGAMYAGRIRVVSTAEGAGVRIGAIDMHGYDGIQVQSAGGLHIGDDSTRNAALRSRKGDLDLSASGDLRLQAVTGEGKSINVNAGQKLTLDTTARENIERDRKSWDKKWLFVTTETYERNTTETERTLTGTHLQADDRLALKSGDDMQLVAATLKAGGELNLDSATNLSIEAGKQSRRVEEQVRHRKHLWRGDSDSDQYQQTAKPSDLQGGELIAKAGEALKVQGSRMHSEGDMALSASQVDIATTALEARGTQRDYRGDLVSGSFFGDREGKDNTAQQVAGSVITSGANLNVTAGQVRVKGSTIASEGESVLYGDKGKLVIEADHSRSSTTDKQSDSKLFGLIGHDRSHSANQEKVLASDVSSKSDLRLASAEELRIQGAKVEAGRQLKIEAKGDLIVESAQARSDSKTDTQQRSLTASARQTANAKDDKPGSRQYEAGVGYAVVSTHSQQRVTEQVGSELKGGSVELQSGAHLQVNGSKVTATTGDLALQGQRITLGATHNDHQTDTQSTDSGGSLVVTGGIDRIGSLFEGHHQKETVRERDSKVQRSELQAGGDVKIDTGTLVTEAARVDAGKALLVKAKEIENRAVQDVHEREQRNDNWRGTLGASLEYRDLTRPIERLILGEEAARFQQASPEDAMAAPSVGGDMTVDHLKRLENQRRGIAQVSELSGASVKVEAERIDDQGTAWRANEGLLAITANQHHQRAAVDEQSRLVEQLAVGGDMRVDTSTGNDLNVRASAKGGSSNSEDSTRNARVGSLYGQTGIQVQLGADGLYEGTRINAGNGDLSITSNGKLLLSAAHDQRSEHQRQTDGNAWAKVGNRPGSTGVEGRGYLDLTELQRQESKAQVGQIDAKGKVLLSSGADLILEGTRIGSREAPTGGIELDSAGLLQVKAAHDSQQASGHNLGGGLELAAKFGTGKGGALGGHFANGKLNEKASQAVDARFDTQGTLQISSRARDDIALHLQGLQASAAQIKLEASKGGMLVEASSDKEQRDNLEITAGAGFRLNRGETPDKDIRGLHGRVQVNLDKRDNQTWNASTLRADRIELASQGDTRIEGASLDADRIRGDIGGDLLLASRKDRVDTLVVKADARLSHEKNPQGYLDAAGALSGPAAGKVTEKVGPTLSKVDPKLSPTVKVEVSHTQRDTVAHQATLKGNEGVELKVGGQARLVGARIQSSAGDVDLQAQSVSRETLTGRDYQRNVSVDFSNSPVDMGTAIAELSKSKGAADGENALDLGLLRTSGHSRSEEWVSNVGSKGAR
ncbi:hemagglutinin repeat-containing protein [Pseudomonas sp. RW10S2]|uniref:hemagglutinin repeat-containing protein n=1 Tax=Pseudomonas sp. RW10S2 TaxID=459637 RepID=UPI001646D78D|nr:hemagglutinin repeat-containing protein [Pseudomonas sp. RW10S2]